MVQSSRRATTTTAAMINNGTSSLSSLLSPGLVTVGGLETEVDGTGKEDSKAVSVGVGIETGEVEGKVVSVGIGIESVIGGGGGSKNRTSPRKSQVIFGLVS